MAATTRDQFMAAIRSGLGRRMTEAPDAPPVDDGLVRLCAAGAGVERFADRARAVGMHVDLVEGRGLRDGLERHLTGAARVLIGVEDPDLGATVEAAVRAAGSVIVDPAADRPAMFEAAVGITDVDAAIAESGTLVVSSSARRSRMVHLVPPVHIAVVRERQIAADLLDYLAAPQRAADIRDHANHALITGPSKTADIEGILVTGVHGPGKVCVIVVREE